MFEKNLMKCQKNLISQKNRKKHEALEKNLKVSLNLKIFQKFFFSKCIFFQPIKKDLHYLF